MLQQAGKEVVHVSNISDLARRALGLARNHIVMHLRFLDVAVFRLTPMPADTSYATEGARLYYGEKHVLRRYLRADQQGLSRDYLHVLLHCVFRHPFIDTLVEPSHWDLACDLAVEDVILSLDDERFALPGDDARRAVLKGLRAQVRPLTAEKLYRRFQQTPPQPGWHELFRVDDHVLWHKPKKARELEPGDGDGEGEDNPSKGGASQSQSRDQKPEGDPPEPSANAPSPSEPGENQPQPEGGGSSDAGEEGDATAAAANASDDGEAEAREARHMRADPSDSPTRRSVGRYDERHDSDQRNVGKGMDTEGTEGSPAGSQSRSARTDGGLDAPNSLGSAGDAADAASQSDRSDSGGSGSGLNDAFAEWDAPAEASDFREDDRDDRDRRQLEKEWRDVGERIQADLDTFSRRRGDSAGDLLERLNELNRERIDYAAFLRKFTVLGEAAELNPDEFDQIFYTYGLKLYKNLPLIEPLETREVQRVRDFVLAIDTSGSTRGEPVKRFIEKTWGILKGEENFFHKFNLYVVQCDAEIREAVRLTTQREFDAYMETFSVKGLGGTDFRPVFEYVDELLRQGAFTRLKGLIYFTDGAGTYPARKPDYETAFAFLPSDTPIPEVPTWAMKVVVEE